MAQHATPIKLAILGCGRQGRVHAETVALLGAKTNVRLHAVYDVVDNAARSLAFDHAHQPEVRLDIGSILTDPSVDGTIIVTPNDTHADLVAQAVEAGKHVLVEKPLDSDLSQIELLRRQLAEIEKKRGKLPYISVAFMKRHDPSVLALKKELVSGRLGELEHLVIHTRDVKPHSLSILKTTGGLIADMTVHSIDLMHLLIGQDDRPDVVSAFGSTLIDPEGCAEIDDVMRATIVVRTKKDRLVTLMDGRRCAMGVDQRVEAHCSKGDMFIDNEPAHHLVTRIANTETSSARPPTWPVTADRYGAGLLEQLREFVGAIRNGGEVEEGQQGMRIGCTVEEGYWVSKTVAAANVALKEGRIVKV